MSDTEVITKQFEFIDFLKKNGIYNPMESAENMVKMQVVWQMSERAHQSDYGLLKIAIEQKSVLLESCGEALKERDQQITIAQRKAELWDAFASLGRIRTLGWANLGEEGYQHIGFEFWTHYGTPEDNYDFTETNAESIKNFEIFLDAWILTKEVDKNGNSSKSKK